MGCCGGGHHRNNYNVENKNTGNSKNEHNAEFPKHVLLIAGLGILILVFFYLR